MSTNTTTYEVRVKVRGAPIEYYARYGRVIYKDIIKMLHFNVRTPKQATDRACKYGEVLSCRKVDKDSMIGNIEKIQLEPQDVYAMGNPYNNALAMDEMIWNKRNNRRNNLHKDKKEKPEI